MFMSNFLWVTKVLDKIARKLSLRNLHKLNVTPLLFSSSAIVYNLSVHSKQIRTLRKVLKICRLIFSWLSLIFHLNIWNDDFTVTLYVKHSLLHLYYVRYVFNTIYLSYGLQAAIHEIETIH